MFDSMTRSFQRSRLINTSVEIDVDWYWWWKIHDVKYPIPRASISVPSLAAGSNLALVTCASASSPSLFLSLSLPPSLFFFSTILPTHLSLPTWAIARCCCWWTSLGQGPPPKTCSSGAVPRSPLRSILSRPTWSTDNAILGVNRRSPGEGEAPRVVLDSVLAMLSE